MSSQNRSSVLRALGHTGVRRHLLHWPAECWRVHLRLVEGAL